jgi:hypothetical protein
MAQWQKVLDRVLGGKADANISFADMCNLLKRLGFSERIEGDHHIFTKPGIQGLIDLQPVQGKCKPYQVKQARKLLRLNNITSVN